MPAFIVSLHDLHRRSFREVNAQRTLLEKWGVPRTSVLIIPQYHHDTEALDFAREMPLWHKQGHDLVLHGYYHDRLEQPTTMRNLFWTRLYTNREAEFLDLPETMARERIEKGKKLFADNGWPLAGFIAPAWLMAPYMTTLLRKMGFAYTTRLTQILPLAKNLRPIQSQSLCYSTRANWRQIVSIGWNSTLFKRVRNNSVLRLSLHPNDFTFPSIQNQAERIVKTALDSGFTPSTYADFVQRLPS